MLQASSAIFRAVSLVALALLAACTLNLNRLPPYNQYVRQTVTLREPMVLIRDSEPSAYSNNQLVRPADVQPNRLPGTWTVLGDLGVGTSFIVKKVRWIRTNNAGGWVLAICEFPKGQEQFGIRGFTYYWGNENLNRAPWEDPGVPADRYVGSHGREYHP